ncbi:hypothetical protein Tco_1104824 [Tanacetum coccineum]
MAQPQRQTDVPQDELCPPNKLYALMDSNKKIYLDNLLCPNESKILANILKNHPLGFSIAASKELTMTLDDFITIYQLPQAIENNHKCFVTAPKFSEMIMQMLYYFVNNIHVDYVDLLWEELHYSVEHATTLIPYPRFTKLIVSHYMTAYLEISIRARDKRRLDQSDGDTWHWRVSVRGTVAVSTRDCKNPTAATINRTLTCLAMWDNQGHRTGVIAQSLKNQIVEISWKRLEAFAGGVL